MVVYWHSPAEWADILYSWLSATGQNKNIFTVYELAHGDFATSQRVDALPLPILREAIHVLAQRGHAQSFSASDTRRFGSFASGDTDPWEAGVKFV